MKTFRPWFINLLALAATSACFPEQPERVDYPLSTVTRQSLDNHDLTIDGKRFLTHDEDGIRISMDGKGRFLDNIFVERLWRSLKYECVYLHARETGSEAKAGVGKWIEFYNRKRPHSALGGKPPAVVYWLSKDETNPDQQEQRVA